MKGKALASHSPSRTYDKKHSRVDWNSNVLVQNTKTFDDMKGNERKVYAKRESYVNEENKLK